MIATNGELNRDTVSAALDTASIEEGPGGPARMVPGTGHCAMNMYIGRAKAGQYEIISQYEMVDPDECA